MSAFVMEAGSQNVGEGFVDSVRRFFFRLVVAVAIVFLVLLCIVLFVPLALIWVIYVTVRSAASGVVGREHRVERPVPANAPIPDADGEGRENVRVRRPNDA